MNKNARKYYRNIKAIIPSKGKYERQLLNKHKEQIILLCENNPSISYSEIEQQLGNPQDFIYNYYNDIDIDYLLKRLRTTRLIRNCTYTFFALLLTVLLIEQIVNIIDFNRAQKTHLQYYSVEIEDITEEEPQ